MRRFVFFGCDSAGKWKIAERIKEKSARNLRNREFNYSFTNELCRKSEKN